MYVIANKNNNLCNDNIEKEINLIIIELKIKSNDFRKSKDIIDLTTFENILTKDNNKIFLQNRTFDHFFFRSHFLFLNF